MVGYVNDFASQSQQAAFAEDVEEAVGVLVSLGQDAVFCPSEIDPHDIRDGFLDLLTDSDRLFGDRPRSAPIQALHDTLAEVYVATFEFDWRTAGPWLLEDAIETVTKLRRE